MSSAPLAAVLYLLVSLVAFWTFFKISKKISGVNFKVGRFWFFFVWMIFWGMVQLDVAQNGYVFFIPASKYFIEDNYVIRWIAFISAVFQTLCLPSKEESRRWFSRK